MSFLINFIVILTTFSYVLNGYAKKKHCNVLAFTDSKGMRFNCLTFTVIDAHVNPSQPSHIELGKQLLYYHTHPLILKVTAGRKKSKSVARYFNDQVGKNNSQGRHFKKLNFAIRGVLALFQDHSCTHKIAEFKDFFIAQENFMFENSWVVGGKKCFYKYPYGLQCIADYDPTKLFWVFKLDDKLTSSFDTIKITTSKWAVS
ncbi:MAG: hypothetical protein OXC48_01905 [Endozoicomonadaceae bacterium]|nr:hypothetical protein [Endozoicomonadaceae bacterium]